MTADQMLWHVNQFLALSMGEGAPTNPNARCSDAKYDFEAERAKCKALIARIVAKPIDGPWPDDPSFGPANGTFVSRLQAKHLDHHFRQFAG